MAPWPQSFRHVVFGRCYMLQPWSRISCKCIEVPSRQWPKPARIQRRSAHSTPQQLRAADVITSSPAAMPWQLVGRACQLARIRVAPRDPIQTTFSLDSTSPFFLLFQPQASIRITSQSHQAHRAFSLHVVHPTHPLYLFLPVSFLPSTSNINHK